MPGGSRVLDSLKSSWSLHCVKKKVPQLSCDDDKAFKTEVAVATERGRKRLREQKSVKNNVPKDSGKIDKSQGKVCHQQLKACDKVGSPCIQPIGRGKQKKRFKCLFLGMKTRSMFKERSSDTDHPGERADPKATTDSKCALSKESTSILNSKGSGCEDGGLNCKGKSRCEGPKHSKKNKKRRKTCETEGKVMDEWKDNDSHKQGHPFSKKLKIVNGKRQNNLCLKIGVAETTEKVTEDQLLPSKDRDATSTSKDSKRVSTNDCSQRKSTKRTCEDAEVGGEPKTKQKNTVVKVAKIAEKSHTQTISNHQKRLGKIQRVTILPFASKSSEKSSKEKLDAGKEETACLCIYCNRAKHEDTIKRLVFVNDEISQISAMNQNDVDNFRDRIVDWREKAKCCFVCAAQAYGLSSDVISQILRRGTSIHSLVNDSTAAEGVFTIAFLVIQKKKEEAVMYHKNFYCGDVCTVESRSFRRGEIVVCYFDENSRQRWNDFKYSLWNSSLMNGDRLAASTRLSNIRHSSPIAVNDSMLDGTGAGPSGTVTEKKYLEIQEFLKLKETFLSDTPLIIFDNVRPVVLEGERESGIPTAKPWISLAKTALPSLDEVLICLAVDVSSLGIEDTLCMKGLHNAKEQFFKEVDIGTLSRVLITDMRKAGPLEWMKIALN